jgi:hypothetical protein
MLASDRVARRGPERRHMSERDSVLQLFEQAPRVFEVPLHLPLELREAFARPTTRPQLEAEKASRRSSRSGSSQQ